MEIKKFNQLNENKNDFEERKEEAKNRKHFYEQIEKKVIYWDDLELDMKRDLGEFTDIKGIDARWIIEWLKNKISDKKIIN
jgi:hypothetical protein